MKIFLLSFFVLVLGVLIGVVITRENVVYKTYPGCYTDVVPIFDTYGNLIDVGIKWDDFSSIGFEYWVTIPEGMGCGEGSLFVLDSLTKAKKEVYYSLFFDY